jgi:hypothetical protein
LKTFFATGILTSDLDLEPVLVSLDFPILRGDVGDWER